MKQAEIVLSPEEAFSETLFPSILYQKLGIKNDGHFCVKPLKRSIDARSRNVVVRIQCEIAAISHTTHDRTPRYPDVRSKKQAVIVGSGPAGLFAALRLIELGIKPIVLERGKDVRTRRRDLAAIN